MRASYVCSQQATAATAANSLRVAFSPQHSLPTRVPPRQVMHADAQSQHDWTCQDLVAEGAYHYLQASASSLLHE